MPNKQLKRGTRALPSKSGQRHSDLGSDRQGFTWFYRFALDRIQAARTNTKFGQDLRSSTISSAMMLRNRNAATFALAISAFQGLSVSAFLLTSK
jgi:hypothetical protein